MIIHGIYVDYPPGQKRVRIGNWVHIQDYVTGEGKWFWDPKGSVDAKPVPLRNFPQKK
jgi:hypothetical protein